MFKKNIKIYYIIFLFIFVLSLIPDLTLAYSHFSDLITNSAPSAPSDHTIIFRIHHNIPPSGRIVITPQDGQFFIMGDFDYTDVDLATSSIRESGYTERNLAGAASAIEDGVSAVASTTNGSIAINLNSTNGISSGDYVRIKLGNVAEYGESGDKQVYNPNSTGPFQMNVKVFSDVGDLLDNSSVLDFIINPVTTSATYGKRRFNATPTGVLGYGTSQTFMSLMTNYRATCRYNTVGTTSYDIMPYTFSYTGDFFHSYTLTGLANGSHYTFYIKCRDQFGVDDETDYLITFMVSGLEGNVGDEGGIPGRGGGGTGGGGGGGTGSTKGNGTGTMLPYPPPPGDPSVVLQGLAYPESTIILLQDGKEQQRIKADSNSQFIFDIFDLPQGVYTFGLIAEDQAKRQSVTQTFTFWLREGTKTELNKIFMPPTIQIDKTTVTAGESAVATGAAAPNADIEVWFYPKSDETVPDDKITKVTAKADASGNWSATINTSINSKGVYKVKAKASTKDMGTSDFSKVLELGVGVNLNSGTCPGADLNKDGKVNLFDFSILLYYWSSNNACADQNQDGTVNLVDFSIMMYNWTG